MNKTIQKVLPWVFAVAVVGCSYGVPVVSHAGHYPGHPTTEQHRDSLDYFKQQEQQRRNQEIQRQNEETIRGYYNSSPEPSRPPSDGSNGGMWNQFNSDGSMQTCARSWNTIYCN